MSAKHKPLLYLETSVFGFCFDKEPRNAIRREAALALFQQVRLGVLDAVTSSVTFLELDRAAEPLRSELMALLEDVLAHHSQDLQDGSIVIALSRKIRIRRSL